MSQENRPYHSNVHLTFPPSVSGSPLVCNLTRLFDLDFNISTAHASAGRFSDSGTLRFPRSLRQGHRLPAGKGRPGFARGAAHLAR